MTRLLIRTETTQASARDQRAPRIIIFGLVAMMGLGLLAIPMLIGSDAFFAASAGCSGQQAGTVGQPAGSAKASAIPANYLVWYKKVGQQYGVLWTLLAGIGTVESDNGQTSLSVCAARTPCAGRNDADRDLQRAGNAGAACRFTRPARWSTAWPPTRTAIRAQRL